MIAFLFSLTRTSYCTSLDRVSCIFKHIYTLKKYFEANLYSSFQFSEILSTIWQEHRTKMKTQGGCKTLCLLLVGKPVVCATNPMIWIPFFDMLPIFDSWLLTLTGNTEVESNKTHCQQNLEHLHTHNFDFPNNLHSFSPCWWLQCMITRIKWTHSM